MPLAPVDMLLHLALPQWLLSLLRWLYIPRAQCVSLFLSPLDLLRWLLHGKTCRLGMPVAGPYHSLMDFRRGLLQLVLRIFLLGFPCSFLVLQRESRRHVWILQLYPECFLICLSQRRCLEVEGYKGYALKLCCCFLACPDDGGDGLSASDPLRYPCPPEGAHTASLHVPTVTVATSPTSRTTPITAPFSVEPSSAPTPPVAWTVPLVMSVTNPWTCSMNPGSRRGLQR